MKELIPDQAAAYIKVLEDVEDHAADGLIRCPVPGARVPSGPAFG